MTKAYLDTTILVNALLKTGKDATAAKAAVARFDLTELPMYAIKELKAGPLWNFTWMHNVLAETQSFFRSLERLQRMSRTPRGYTTSTAIEALKTAAEKIAREDIAHLEGKYGKRGNVDFVLADMYRLSIKTKIQTAWKRRHSVAMKTVLPLSCYVERAPYDERGLLKLAPTECLADPECCLASSLKSRPDDLRKLKRAVDSQPLSREHTRRSQTLSDIARKPKDPVTNDMCRSLGDAIFAFFAPADAVILTTNVADHQPLAHALGKTAEAP
jgi:hypothetical protein